MRVRSIRALLYKVVCSDSHDCLYSCINKVIMRPQVQVNDRIVTWSHCGHFN